MLLPSTGLGYDNENITLVQTFRLPEVGPYEDLQQIHGHCRK